MKKLIYIIFSLLPLSTFAVNRTITINAPATVYAGQSLTIPTSASTDATDSEQIGFYHAEYSTDGGNSWTGYSYDVNVGKSATRNAYITAGNAGSHIQVRVKIAFRGGSAGDVDYTGYPIDWGGTWSSWSGTSTVYAYLNVIAPPNDPPSVTWQINPSSAAVNEWYQIQARAYDGDSNLATVNVWKDGVPFAFNSASGQVSYSDANYTYNDNPNGSQFKAQSSDSAGAYSAFIYHNITITNDAPDQVSLTPTATSLGWNSTYGHYTMNAYETLGADSMIHDPNGNLKNHTVRYQKVTGSSPDNNAWVEIDSSNATISSNFVYTSNRSVTVPVTITPGRWDINMFGHDGYLTHPGTSVTIWAYGQTNGATFISQSVPSTMTTGDAFNVSVTMQNSGDKPWNSDGTPHRLGSQNPGDNIIWGLHRVSLGSSEVINPGASKIFSFTVAAPTTPGSYNFQWRMVEDGIEWFGATTTNLSITVNDNDPPQTPAAPSVSNVAMGSFTANWSAPSDNGTVNYYQYELEGVLSDYTSATSQGFSGLATNTTYRVRVKARDAAGNWSTNWSNWTTVTTASDPNADDDGDGLKNWQEALLGTNPQGTPLQDTGNLSQLKIMNPTTP